MKRLMRGAMVILMLLGMTCFCTNAKDVSAAEKAVPVFSKESGWYKNEFQLEITPSKENCKVYYTLDGSEPTTASTEYSAAISVVNRNAEENVYSEKDGMMYDYNKPYKPGVNGFKIEKATIVRAIAVDTTSGETSNIVTKTYFAGGNETYGDLPVISIVTDPANLFSEDRGIYTLGDIYSQFVANGGLVNYPKQTWNWMANFTQSGSAWERDANLTFFEGDKSLGFTQEVAVRIQGNTTRIHNQKGFNIKTKKGINGSTQKNVQYDLFPGNVGKATGQPITTYKDITLRAGGDDTYYSKMKDTWMQSLVGDRAMATQSSRACVVFLDGEFWGIYNIREKYNSTYFASHYGVDKDDVVIIKDGTLDSDPLDETIPLKETPEYKLYSGFVYWIGVQDMTVDANYQKWLNLVDKQSFMDYYATEIIAGNRDWPYGNEILWRTRENAATGDGKWRWALNDIEDFLGHRINDSDYYGSDATKNYTWDAIGNACTRMQMFGELLKNPSFKRDFVCTLMDLYNKNMQVDVVTNKLKSLTNQIEPYMEDNYKRFGVLGSTEYFESYKAANFDGRIDRDIKRYQERYNWLPTYFKEKLNLHEASTLTIQSNIPGNTVKVNTILPDMKNQTWSGKYYSDCPITLKANDVSGYTFTGWTTSANVKLTSPSAKSTQATIPTGNVTIKANYVKGTVAITKPQVTPDKGKVTTVTAPKRVVLRSVKNKRGKKALVKFAKVSGAKGYQIFYSTKKNFKSGSKKVLTKKTSTLIKKLKKGKTYYFKVRAYKLNGSKKVYGKWSKVKKLKIRK